MVNFRKMKIDDMDYIYNNPEFRKLITVEPKGEKFAIVALEDDNIIGGLSGFIDDKIAMIQCVIIEDREDNSLILDGLIRSSIHILELDGNEYLFVNEGFFANNDNEIYQRIGFEPYLAISDKNISLGSLIKSDISSMGETTFFINLPDFFK